jgi:tetratricopeptide (TPR) repeat protein
VPKAKGLVQQAVDAYTRAVDLDKEDLASQTWLGDAVHSLGKGEKDQAYDIYRQVIEQSKAVPRK